MRFQYTIFITVLTIVLAYIPSLNAQEDSEILDSYEGYTEAAREVVYLHLNKSTYIKGENIGFTAYVLDKKDKKPSFLTTNLYVSIADKDNKVLKQKLIKVVDGIASNTFEIDSLFSSGHYKIKAYTNWMLNFNEQNYYSESIKIIDFETEDSTEEQRTENSIDAKFLPESGHLLNGVINVIGAVIKDQNGFGMPYAKCEVVDKNNELLTSFETNQFGIGKFQLLPEIGNHYKVNVKSTNKDFTFNINQNIEDKGIIISLKSLNSKVFVSLITNEKTLETIKNKRHTLMIHNGDLFDIMDVYFTDTTEIIKTIEYSNTATGINILTLFNENDQPIAERLFFNYEGVSIAETNTITAKQTKDSTTLHINFKGINTSTSNTLSISILPKETKSYNKHHNFLSYNFLAPYVNGTIEDAKYYFTNINAKKKFELDNLLITQGWSSYNWQEIFNNTHNFTHAFEQGITVKANLTANDLKVPSDLSFQMHAYTEKGFSIFQVKKGDLYFVIENLFLEENNTLKISKRTAYNSLVAAKLYLQYFPNKIPVLNDKKKLLVPKFDYKPIENLSEYRSHFDANTFNRVQKLDEVTVKGNITSEKQRAQHLNRHAFGKIIVVDEEIKTQNATLTHLLTSKGLRINDDYDNGELAPPLQFNVFSSFSENPMLFYLDDMLLVDTSILRDFDISKIDYLEINKTGIAQGLQGDSGVVKIYLNKYNSALSYNKTTTSEFKLPIAFSPKKTYYAPKYNNTDSSFYQSYGVIDWQPEVKIDNKGNATIKLPNYTAPFTLYMEGITRDGVFIVEEKTLSLK
ncbi:hypothetical protein [Winogradskyella psychrotolerans]|uniref:hypothetical protein n=1 Tax=Winogradskyella psychrotolerans TaxID=1344585 RepID=UPI001C06E5DF|nr:hypothetical protein [Winogradskyella psychrotolerans]MBU2926934.1 hypothetical protein [Winogradskyella psychrotolerans]